MDGEPIGKPDLRRLPMAPGPSDQCQGQAGATLMGLGRPSQRDGGTLRNWTGRRWLEVGM